MLKTSSCSLPITRRMINQFLLYSLGCLFLCITMVLTLQSRGDLLAYRWSIVLIPGVCLLAGMISFRYFFRLTARIDRQLRDLAVSPHLPVTPIYSQEQAALGWNHLVSRLDESRTFASLEARLSDSLTSFQNQQFETIFKLFPEGLVLTNAEGIIQDQNNAFTSLLNINDLSVIENQPIIKLLSLDKHPDENEIRQKLSHDLVSFVFEIEPAYLPQKTIIRVSRQKLQSPGMEPAWLWCFRDVTQAKLSEEMRNQFVFTATHELRTPLANIQAYAETLALDDQIDVEQQKGFCNIINAEVTRLSRFVDELLNVSQMEAGALSLRKQETQLMRLFEDVLEHVKPQMEQKQIQLEVILPPKLPDMHLDKDKFSASLVNLLGNAAKYTPEGGEVRFVVSQNPNSIQIEVEDKGYGISEEELTKVFDKFFRSDDQRVRNVSGSGLGLAFTREAIRLHGGEIEVESELNQGTKFIVTLPI